MLCRRIIFAFAMSLVLIVSMAPGKPAVAMAEDNAAHAHACCTKDAEPGSPPKKERCDGGPCAMHCCRVIPPPVDVLPRLVDGGTVVQIAIVTPAALHTLTDPQAVFHPPRA